MGSRIFKKVICRDKPLKIVFLETIWPIKLKNLCDDYLKEKYFFTKINLPKSCYLLCGRIFRYFRFKIVTIKKTWSPGVWWENQIMGTKAYVGKNMKYSLTKSNVIKYIISYMQTVWHIVDFQLLRQLPLDNIWAQSGAQCLIKYIGV